MQFDKARIVIRERPFLDLLDLGLWVVRTHLGWLALAWIVGILPCVALNHWLASDTLAEMEDLLWDEEYVWDYALVQIALVAWQAPLAMSPATVLLGQLLFQERPQLPALARDWLRSLPQMFLLQVVVRGLALAGCVTFLGPLLFWPYLGEVILLERNKLWRRGRAATLSRTAALHSSDLGLLFARFLGSLVVAVVMFCLVGGGLWTARGAFTGRWEISPAFLQLVVPAGLWTITAFFTVVRFLSYLDLRIRFEGWEVTLNLRAEAARLARQAAA